MMYDWANSAHSVIVVTILPIFYDSLTSNGVHAVANWGTCTSIAMLLVALMAADYLTGVLVAAVWQRSDKSATGALDSKAGFRGLVKKGMILLLVWLGVLLDEAVGAGYVRMAVVLFFLGNEGLSLLENLGLMGIPFPAFLRRALEALREQGDGGQEDRHI